MNSKEQTMEKIRQKLNEDVALYDCQGDCPDEVAINPDLRTDSYCDKCFAKQLVLIMEQTGYVIIEGDGKGLSENPYYEKWTKTNGSGYRDLMDGFEEGTIAQKALDDKELKARISELEYEIVKLKEKIPTVEEAKHILKTQRDLCELGKTENNDGSCYICRLIEAKLQKIIVE
jgi:hypothetical protein